MRCKILVLAILFLFSFPQITTGQFSLWVVEKRLAMKYSVPNISHQDLWEKLSSREATHYMLFDTREKEEYDTSHISSAIHIDPEMSSETFINRFGDRIKGKHLVFYCSVGDRSSSLLGEVQERAMTAGAVSLSNLRGGIFRWYNENYPVVNDKGETDALHPFDEKWGTLIKKRNDSFN